jgi:peptidyl-prolyl cis-trans isomerase A (cyclophilin A)
MPALALLSLALGAALPQPKLVVRIETTAGAIRAVLEAEAAPVTVCNFLRYMRAGDFDGGRFFRTVRSDLPGPNPVPIDVIQMEARQGPEFDGYGPIPLERTSHTGLRHVAGALSMARWGPDTGTSSWSIVVRPSAGMDEGGRRNPDRQGFAVFGRVVGGMGVVRAIHRMPAKDEKLQQPVTIRKIAIERSSARTFRTIWSRCQRAR